MYQTLTEPAVISPSFSPIVLKSVNEEMQLMHFMPTEASVDHIIFRDGERFVCFDLNAQIITVRLGVGASDKDDLPLTSMGLDEMVAYLYGGMKRGCQAVDDRGLTSCLDAALKDLKEFAHEFLRGDFRPFLRVLAIKKREDRELAKAKQESKIYLA